MGAEICRRPGAYARREKVLMQIEAADRELLLFLFISVPFKENVASPEDIDNRIKLQFKRALDPSRKTREWTRYRRRHLDEIFEFTSRNRH